MRKIFVSTFMTMDGVLQAPGGPEEDPTDGFEWGGWSVNYWDDLMNHTMGKIMSQSFDLLLGRRTYEIFAAHWPYQDDEIGQAFSNINKYVVATTPIDTSWKNSVLIEGDVVKELKKLKAQEGRDLFVNGSGKLVQTLLANGLVDELHTWVFPVTLGKGIRLFGEGTRAQQWKVTDTVVSTTGVVITTYVPDGNVQLGSFVPEKISEAEVARRKKWGIGV